MGWFDDVGMPPGSAHIMDQTNIGGVTSNGVPVNTAGPVASAKLGDSGGAQPNLSDPNAWMSLVQQGPQAVGDWLASSNPQLAQLFQQNPGLKDYYAQQIIKSPGANPTEQAGSAQYWTNKALQDPGITGQQGGQNGGAVTVGGVPGIDPSYGFRFNQGLDALQKSAASRGTLLTGGTLKGITNYGQGAASTEYGADFNRQFSLAGLGENAAANVGNNTASNVSNINNQYGSLGNAQAAGTVGIGNAIGSGVNGALNGYQMNQSSYNPYSLNNLSGGR